MYQITTQDKLIRSTQIGSGNIIGAGDCVIFPSGPTQPSAGPFTLTFDTGDVIDNVQPGDSYYFGPNSFQTCRIDSITPTDTIAVQFGYGRKYQLGGPSGSPINPITVVSSLVPRWICETTSVPPGGQNTVLFPTTNAVSVTMCTDENALNGIWVQPNAIVNPPTGPLGIYCAPGIPQLMPAYTLYAGEISYGFWNPGSSTILIQSSIGIL